MANKFVTTHAGAKKAETRVNDIFVVRQLPGEGLRDFLARFNRQISFHTTAAPIPSIAASFSTFPSSLVAALLLLLELLICQAYAYILNNCDEVQEYIREHEVEVNNQRRGSRWSNAKNHSQNFSQWFETRVLHEDVSDLIKQLSIGPNSIAKRYSGYLINGYRFHTRQRDARHKTQNSGVTLDVLTTSFASSKDKTPVDANLTYYGRIIDIVELDYYGHFKVVLFKCDWYEVEEDIKGLTYVYFNKKCYQEEPFILAYQAHQCFCVQDPYDQDKHYVMKTVPRDLFSISGQIESNALHCYENEPSEHLAGPSMPDDNGEVVLIRNHLQAMIIDVPPKGFLA
ncbi:uncharacterized protein [Nicotiana sylvestris]|uniref:uncharacterized protein n=1 Tax=Nicotiana sylvestris TaxID=4096 RepID=UPI00388CDCAE